MSLTAPAATARAGVRPAFGSIVFDDPDLEPDISAEPEFFGDLNLDQLVTSVLTGRDEYDLAAFFSTPLTSVQTVMYRQQVFRDLETAAVAEAVTAFADQMREVRRQTGRARRMRFPLQRQAWHLSAARTYVAAVHRLGAALDGQPLASAGLAGFAHHLLGYRAGDAFQTLAAEADAVQAQLDQMSYRLRVHGDRVQVSLPKDEDDYAANVTATFARFRQGPVTSYRSRLQSYDEMNHVEEAVVVRVAKLHPTVFAALATFCSRYPHFTSAVITRFDREVQFYLAWLSFAARLRAAGLALCYPEISDRPTPLRVVGGYDAALADKLTGEARPVVANDVDLSGDERIQVVTGPNQGGKTTYARMVGQLHYLASLGLLVPGTAARLPLPDRIFTHFERGENLHDLTGKLDDDLVRIRDILDQATPASLLIVNEIFTSTSVEDAVWLATQVLHRIIDLGCLCVCVTFLDELTTLSPTTVSLVATVNPDDPTSRTLHVVRRPADGRAYADAVAARYRLTRSDLHRRLTA